MSVSVVNPQSLIIALDVGGTNCRGEVLRWNGMDWDEPLARRSVQTPKEGGTAVIEAIVGIVRELQADLSEDDRERIAVVGVGIPGVVDSASGFVYLAANLGWRERDAGQEISSAVGMPVFICNDVIAAGTAEQKLGAGRGSSHVLSVFLGTGISASITVDGHLIRGGVMPNGVRQPAGEIGHLPIVPDGLPCGCGQRGCLEMYCSARSFGRLYSEALGIDPLGPGAKTAKDLVDAREHDTIAREIWAMATKYLAHGLLAVSTVCGPTKIVLGGGLANAGETLTDAVTAHYAAMSTVFQTPEIVLAELGQRAGVQGVGLLALAHMQGSADSQN